MATPDVDRTDLHLAVALDGAGWHPSAWREPDAHPKELLSAGYWVDLVTEAERGLLDLVMIEDTLGLQSSSPWKPDARVDQVRGRLDAVLVAARVAPLTSRIGIVPTQVVTHTEPFHASKAIATLDHVSTGRAGVRVRASRRRDEAALFGRQTTGAGPLGAADDAGSPSSPPEAETGAADPFAEAADYVEVMRRLWDSWEDDAEIRDVATGRFVDREKLHYIDFTGPHFAVRGPSITPRPPQGQPLVAALGHQDVAYRLIGRQADLGFITPQDTADVLAILGLVRAEQEAAGRADVPLPVLGDVVVFLDDTAAAAAERKDRLDGQLGREYRSDAHVFVGTPAQLADLAQEWASAGLAGLQLRPAALPHDLTQITRGLAPELARRGVFRQAYAADTLRGHFGLPRPANRYARSVTA